MYTLMRDPVILPSSRTTIDRSTIKAHLLSDPTDPFNRAPLSIDDVVPNDELRRKIADWIAEQRSKGKALDAPKPAEAMDVDENL
ncbi:Ubiquitin conjugation factor E4 A [Tulasnella sp. 427]|nr:Ubiquitin conjugation factor E4 A [Tulasnella sp. 427]